jgi:hypothetical protein
VSSAGGDERDLDDGKDIDGIGVIDQGGSGVGGPGVGGELGEIRNGGTVRGGVGQMIAVGGDVPSSGRKAL